MNNDREDEGILDAVALANEYFSRCCSDAEGKSFAYVTYEVGVGLIPGNTKEDVQRLLDSNKQQYTLIGKIETVVALDLTIPVSEEERAEMDKSFEEFKERMKGVRID